MGASFRNVNQIIGLCGCDNLTISPALLEELNTMSVDIPLKLSHPPGRFLINLDLFIFWHIYNIPYKALSNGNPSITLNIIDKLNDLAH